MEIFFQEVEEVEDLISFEILLDDHAELFLELFVLHGLNIYPLEWLWKMKIFILLGK